MVLLKKVKKSLRKIVPAGRTYIDKKFEDQKENIFSEIKEQNIALEDELRSSLSEFVYETAERDGKENPQRNGRLF